LQCEATRSKVSKIIDKYDQRQREINIQYAEIDHRTAEGKKCLKAFTQAHDDFITELDKLSGMSLKKSMNIGRRLFNLIRNIQK
jgi:hypothetical protein